jgi:hypothetical protein
MTGLNCWISLLSRVESRGGIQDPLPQCGRGVVRIIVEA